MNRERLHATYLIETPQSLERAAEVLAGEQSTGTFVQVPGETAEIKARFRTRIEEVVEFEPSPVPSFPQPQSIPGTTYRRGTITVSIPMEMAGSDLTTLLSSVAGNVFELKEVSGLRLVDLELPTSFIEGTARPRFGVAGTRRICDVWSRPIIGSVVKPGVGLAPEEIAALVKTLLRAGIDFIKDDELLVDPAYCPFADRVAAVMRVMRDHQEKTGRQVIYAFNITGEPDTLMRRHEQVVAAGGTCVQVNLNQVGIAGVSHLRRNGRLAIHGHRAGWGMIAREPYFGLSFRVYAKLWRMTGVDHLIVNGMGNAFWEGDKSAGEGLRSCLDPLLSPDDRALPALGSAQWGGTAAATLGESKSLDLLHIAGGGILDHPAGVIAGVSAMRQAWEAALLGIPLEEAAKTHEELRISIEKFGKRSEAAREEP